MPTVTRNERLIPLANTTRRHTISKVNGVFSESETLTQSGGSLAGYRLTRSWTRTPNYRKLKASGELPMNPASSLVFDEQVGAKVVYLAKSASYTNAANYSYVYTTDTLCARNYYVLPGNPQALDLNSGLQAVSRLNARMKNAEWQAPVFVIEAKKTVQMVLGTVKTISKVYFALRSGRFLEATSLLGLTRPGKPITRRVKRIKVRYDRTRLRDPSKAASNALLEMRYGWIPMLRDIKDAAETLAEMVSSSPTKDPLRCRASATIKRQVNLSTVVSGVGTFERLEKQEESTRYTVYYYPTALDLPGSFGLLNPLGVLWEATSLSFVADWFLPIGTYIQHLDVGLRFSFVKGLTSKKVILRDELTGVKPVAGGVWDGVTDRSYSHWITAAPLTSVPTPSFSQLRPKFDLGSGQVFAALALLRQRLGR